MMRKTYFGLIMAGGQGTRFWPYSTEAVPKQFLHIVGNEPLILQTFNRLKTLIQPDHIYIVADQKYLNLIRSAIPGFRKSNFIAEPSPKNTAPCLIMANIILSRKDRDANLLVVPSDHHIPEIKPFCRQMKAALAFADNRFMITAGIRPAIPHTGYGYIHFDPSVSSRFRKTDFYPVIKFVEKPELARARRYVKKGTYFWNSGIFVYKLTSFREFIQKYNSYFAEQYERLEKSLADRAKFHDIFNRIKPESIDYALMERLKEVRMFAAEFAWNDVGSWSSVHELNAKDKQNNVKIGDHITIECRNSLLFSNQHVPIAAIGLDGMAVIHTENGILVAPVGELQKVKDIRRYLK